MKLLPKSLRWPLALLLSGCFGLILWHAGSGPTAQPHGPRVLFYQDAMHPWVKSHQPGKCAICAMDLTPIYEGEKGMELGPNLVALSSNSITVLHVQTEPVQRRALVRTLRVAGTLELDETRKTILSAPAPGRIDTLGVEYAGVDVQEGQRLVAFYSPELAQEKRRYLVRTRVTSPPGRIGGGASARTDTDPYVALTGWGPRIADAVTQARLEADPYYHDLIAPFTGTVIERNVYPGQYVAEGQKLFTVADLSVLWFRFDVYERQLPWFEPGQIIEMTVSALPGKTFPAVVSFLEPTLNDATRSLKVRADMTNPPVAIHGGTRRLLRCGMYAEGQVRAQLPEVLTVPRSAILFPGAAAYAYVVKAACVYERRRVQLGRQGDELWEVLQGLEEGETVVTSGNLLLDAQAQLNQFSPLEQAAAKTTVSASPRDDGPQGLAIAQDQTSFLPLPTGEGKAVQHAGQCPAPPIGSSASAQLAPASQTTSSPSESSRRTPGRMRAGGADGGYQGDHSGVGRAIWIRADQLRAAELAEARTSKTARTNGLASSQHQALAAFLAVADGLSQALAADNLGRFNQQFTNLSSVVQPLQKEFDSTSPWHGSLNRLAAASKGQPANDLADARKHFLPLSTAAVELATQLRKADPAFAGLKIYHCPMAPKPGLWLQAKGPLRNPFYGSRMLNCGEEVAPSAGSALPEAAP